VTRGTLVAAACAALFSTGCAEHVLGTHDVVVDYAFEGPVPTGEALHAAQDDARARLAAGHVVADVELRTPPDAPGLRIVLDESMADVADDLLTWRGGLDVYRLDPAVAAGAAGRVGSALRAARTARTEGRITLVEPSGEGWARPRVAFANPVIDLTDDVVKISHAKSRQSITITLKPDALRRVAPGEDKGKEGGTLVVARGRIILAEGTPTAPEFTIPFGNDLYAYATAHDEKQLLSTPVLPRLVRSAERPLPPNGPLAFGSIALPMLLSFAWLLFVRRFDRAQPEPWWLVLVTFVFGGLSTVPAALAEYAFAGASPYLDPRLATFGGQIAALPFALLVFALVVGVSEEGAKFLSAWSIAGHSRAFDEPVDGIVYGAAASLGFAAVENVQYFAVGRLSPLIVVARAFTSIPAHLFFGAIWGYALGQRLVTRRPKVLLFLLGAALWHGAFDTFLSIDGLAPLALVANVAGASLFIVLLRRALRFGVVDDEMRAQVAAGAFSTRAESRILYRVGRPRAFAALAVLLHVLAAVIFSFGVALEISRSRPTLGLFVLASLLVLALGVVADALTRAMPLDVALGEDAITFAGVTRALSRIRAIEIDRKRRCAFVRSPDGDLEIGPAPEHTLEAFVSGARERLAGHHSGT
jgi:RsiW-degrading membrane proteinase PrsW (M82 family)